MMGWALGHLARGVVAAPRRMGAAPPSGFADDDEACWLMALRFWSASHASERPGKTARVGAVHVPHCFELQGVGPAIHLLASLSGNMGHIYNSTHSTLSIAQGLSPPPDLTPTGNGHICHMSQVGFALDPSRDPCRTQSCCIP